MAKTPNRGKTRKDGLWVRPSRPKKAPTLEDIWNRGVGDMANSNRYLALADIALRAAVPFPAKKELHKKRSA